MAWQIWTHTHTHTHTLLSFFAVQVRDMAWQIWPHTHTHTFVLFRCAGARHGMADLDTHTHTHTHAHTHFCPFSLCRCEIWHGRSGRVTLPGLSQIFEGCPLLLPKCHFHLRHLFRVRSVAMPVYFQRHLIRVRSVAMPVNFQRHLIRVPFSSCACVLSEEACFPEPYIYTVYDRIFGEFPAKMPHTVYIYGSGQPYLYAVVLINVTTKVKSQHI